MLSYGLITRSDFVRTWLIRLSRADNSRTGRQVALVGVFLLLVVLRLPYLSAIKGMDWDESLYMTIAQDIVKGGLPYKTSWEHKGPFLFYFLAIPCFFFKSQLLAQRIFAMLTLFGSGLLLYLLGRRFCGRRWAVFAPFLFVIGYSWMPGQPSNAEIFTLLPVLASLAFLVVTPFDHGISKSNAKLRVMFSGVMFSLVLRCKINVVFCLAGIPWLLIRRESHPCGKIRYGETFAIFAWFLLGLFPVPLLTMGYFWSVGILKDFWDAYIVFNLAYSTQGSIRVMFANFWKSILVQPLIPWSVTAIVCCLVLIWRRQVKLIGLRECTAIDFLLVTFFGSAVAVLAPRFVFNHYFLLFLPSVCLLAGYCARVFLKGVRGASVALLSLIGLLVVLQAPGALMEYRKNRADYRRSPLMKTAEYIHSHTSPSDTIFVLGGNPILYFLTDRIAPTRYFWWVHHTGFWGDLLHAQNTPYAEIQSKPPRYFILFNKKNVAVPHLDSYAKANYFKEAEFGPYEILRIKKERGQ